MEVLITLAVAGIIMVILAGVTRDTLSVKAAVANMYTDPRTACNLLSLFRTDLLAFTDNPAGENPFAASISAGSAEMSFYRATDARASSDAELAGQGFASVKVRYVAQRDGDGLWTLSRGERVWGVDATVEETVIPVARKLDGVEFAYFDGSVWQEAWDVPESPRQVRVRFLSQAGDEGKENLAWSLVATLQELGDAE